MEHDKHPLNRFCQEFASPFDFFRKRKEVISGLLTPFVPSQRTLFDNGESVEELLDEVEELYSRRKLYRCWTQSIGSKRRHLAVPHPSFRRFINLYLLPLIKQRKNHEKAHGGESGWTTRKSLESHLPVGSVLSFDLENAFNNIGAREVFDFFYNSCNCLCEWERVCSAGFFTMLLTVTYNAARSLPQGASHSMALFNRILHGLDVVLDSKSSEKGFNYTRWVDDITISSRNGECIEELLGAVELTAKRLPVARHKLYFQDAKNPVYLLGHVIDNGRIYKNSREDREINKISPLDYDNLFTNGENRYISWN